MTEEQLTDLLNSDIGKIISQKAFCEHAGIDPVLLSRIKLGRKFNSKHLAAIEKTIREMNIMFNNALN